MQAIKREELFQDNILKNFREDIELTTEAAKQFSDSLLRVVKDQAAVAKSTKNNAEGYRQLVEAEKKSVSAMTEKEKIDKRIITLQKQSTQVTKLQRAQQQALSVEIQRRNRIAKQEAQLTNMNLTAYERLQIKIKKLSDEYRSLIAQEGKETRQSRVLRQEILALNAVRDKSNEALGMHQHKVGQYERAIGGLTRTLGALGLSFGVFTLLTSTLGIITDYEKATASLSAITGATGEELDRLKGKIISLSQEMGVSVTQTTKLFEIVGSQMPQLLKDTEGLNAVAKASIILSKASGDTIEASTLSMASAMNQFNLGADQAERVMNVLAAGSLVGSAGITDVSEAMKNFGSVAAGANITLEQSVALIEVLAKFGVAGAEAGTKLRGSVLKLQQANFGYASGQFEINDALEEARLKMESLGTQMEKDAFLQKTFGAENIATGRILLANTALFEEYTKGVTDTNVATEQAAINSDTMKVVIEELKAAWENLVVKWSEGTGILSSLKAVLRFVANNLEMIVKVLLHGLRAWIAYRLQIRLFTGEVNKATGVVRMGLIPSLWASAKAVMASAQGFKIGSISAKAFGNALKSIPFLAIISGIASIVSLFSDAADETEELVEETSALEQATKSINEQYAKERAELFSIFEALKKKKLAGEDVQKQVDATNAKYGITLQNLSDETAFVNQLNVAYQELLKTLKQKVRFDIAQEKRVDLITQQIALEEELLILENELAGAERNEFGQPTDFRFSSHQAKIINLKGQIREIDVLLQGLDTGPMEEALGGGGVGGGTSKHEERRKTQFEIDQEYFKRFQENNANNLKVIENNAIKSGKEQEEIADIMAAERLDILKLENERALELFGEFSDEYITANLALNKELAIQKENNFTSELERNRKYFEELKKTNEENISLLENDLLRQGKGREEIEEALKKQRLENLQKENDTALRLFGEYSAEYQEANLALHRALLTQEEEAQKKREEMRAKAMEAMENAFQDLVNTMAESMERMNTLLDRGITRQEQLFNDSKDREAELRKIAEERGLNATESIEHERDVQKQAQLEIDKLEAKKRELELTIAALKLLSDGHSVADIKSQLGDIMAFAKNLPTFYTGTPHTVADSLGATGTRDGHVVRVDDNEAIFTGKQTAALGIGIGGRSTQDVVDMVTGGILKDSLRLAIPANNAMRPSIHIDTTSQILAAKMDEVIENTRPENQPVSNMGFNAMVGYFELDYRDKLRREKTRYFTRKPHK